MLIMQGFLQKIFFVKFWPLKIYFLLKIKIIQDIKLSLSRNWLNVQDCLHAYKYKFTERLIDLLSDNDNDGMLTNSKSFDVYMIK